MAVTFEHLVLRGIRVIGARAELKRIGASEVMERTTATSSFSRRQSHRSNQANYPLAKRDPRDRRLAKRAGRPGSVSVVPVSGSPASALRLAGRWCSGLATAQPAAPACPAWRGRPNPVLSPMARHHGPGGRGAGLKGSTTVCGAFTVSLRGRGGR
jgi:hypothetical protein